MTLKSLKITISIFILTFIVMLCTVLYVNHRDKMKYQQAVNFKNSFQYEEACNLFDSLDDFKDSKNQLKNTKALMKKDKQYKKAIQLYQNKQYKKAIYIFQKTNNYKDSRKYLTETIYLYATNQFKKKEYIAAQKYFLQIPNFRDANEYLERINVITAISAQKKRYKTANQLFKDEKYSEALTAYQELGNYKNSKLQSEKCKIFLKRSSLNHNLAAGVQNSAAIKRNGKVVVVGTNDGGQYSARKWNNIISLDTYGCFIVGLRQNHKVVYSGKSTEQISVKDWKSIVDVACGENFIVGLNNKGQVFGTGHNASGQLNFDHWTNVKDIDTGWSYTVGLTKNSNLLFAGSCSDLQEQYNSNKRKWKNVVSIAASGSGSHPKQRGKGHVVGLRKNGTVVAIGDNSLGQCEVSNWKNIVKIAAGDWYTVGIDTRGKVLITGKNFPGTKYIDDKKIAKLSNIIDCAAGFGQTLLLKKDGTITAFGFDDENKMHSANTWTSIRCKTY